MAFEQELPVWLAPGNDPSEEAKNNGWGMGQHPPADWFNWQWNRTYLALKEIQEKVALKDDVSYVDLTPLETEINKLKQSTVAHQAEDATLDTKGHVQLSSSTTSSSETMAATPKAVKKVMDQANSAFMQSDNYNIYKTGKDAKKVYTVVDYKRPNGLIWKKSILSNADTNGNYRTQTINFYDELGTTVTSSERWTITYDSEGDVVSEVKA